MRKLLLLSMTLLLGSFAFSSFSPSEPISDGYSIGDEASDFKLKNVDGWIK